MCSWRLMPDPERSTRLILQVWRVYYRCDDGVRTRWPAVLLFRP